MTKDEKIELDNLREEHTRLKEKKAHQKAKEVEESQSGSEGEEEEDKPKARKRAAASSSDSDCEDEYGDEVVGALHTVDVKK